MNSLRIGWSAIVATAGATPLIGYADAQMSRLEQANTTAIVKTVTPPPSVKTTAIPGWAPWIPIVADPPTPGRKQDTVVIRYGNGGRVDEHRQRFADYRLTKTKVEIRGPCYSACTLVLGYVGGDNICIAEGAFMAFHAIRSMEKGERMDYETWQAYNSMPPEIRFWIDDNGGADKLPLHGYWTLYDRQMWAMGYSKCK